MQTTAIQYLALSDGVYSVWQRDARADGGWTDTGLGEKPSALLSLLLASGQPVHRTLVCRLLWPDSPERAARNCLRQALFRIRGKLGRDSVQEVNGGLAITLTGLHSERDPQAATRVQELREVVGRRPRLRLVGREDAEPLEGSEWRGRVEAFLADPAAQLPRPVTRLTPPDPGPAPDRPRGGARAAVGSTPQRARGRPSASAVAPALPHVPSGTRLLVLDLGPEPVASPRDAACRVVKQLWELRGAVGVEPAYRITLERCQRGGRVTMEALWVAIEDLLAAIVEEGPVVFRVAATDRWPRVVLRRLTAALERLRTSPLTLLGTELQLPPSYDRSAPALDDLSPADAGRSASRTARG